MGRACRWARARFRIGRPLGRSRWTDVRAAVATVPLEAAGVPLSAATSPLDAATSPLDAATSPLDAATSPLDAATSPLEVGTSPLEVGRPVGRSGLPPRLESTKHLGFEPKCVPRGLFSRRMRKRDDETMLLLLAQQGDRDALNTLLERVQDRLFRYICDVLATEKSQAEDVLQNTLLRIARKLRWLSEPAAFGAWTFRIASNEARRALERSRRWIAEDPIDETIPNPALPLSDLEREELREWVGGLSPASRAVVLLHYQEGRSLEEVASILEIPLGTVKSRLAYGLKCLRERWKQ
jgi:RNA polymerase sigma-70 factor (ECF subfamily)